jgi:Alpha/beta hydrolase family
MMKLRTAALAVGILTATLGGFEAHAQPATPVEARNVVLIHGAWEDGSSWAEVIPRLQAAGLKVTAVQNPLTTLADSVAATRRALALQDGPTVLVAHSWGGTVLSEVGSTPRSRRLSMSRRGHQMPEKISSRFQGSFLLGQCGRASSNTTVSPQFRRRRFFDLSRTVSSTRKQKCFMLFRSRRPPLCSANEPQRLPGTPNHHGMRCRNSIRRSIPT